MLLNARLAHSLESTRRTGTQVAALFLEITRFKAVHDTPGGAVGDRSTEMCGDIRLAGAVRRGPSVRRWGGARGPISTSGEVPRRR